MIELLSPPDGPYVRYELNLRVVTQDPDDDLPIPYDRRRAKFTPLSLHLAWERDNASNWTLQKVVAHGAQRLKDGTLGTVAKSAVFHVRGMDASTSTRTYAEVSPDAPDWVRDAVEDQWPQ